ncbi:MAG: membrane protein insertase YidC [Gemmatimonadota bacterium]
MDRRVLWAIALMIVIAVVPTVFLKKPVRPVPAQQVTPPDSAGRPADSLPRLGTDTSTADTSLGQNILVTSPLYSYGISTLGGRLVDITLPRYKSFAKSDTVSAVQLLPPESDLLGLKLLVGQDTLRLNRWLFTPSAQALTASPSTPLLLTASRGGVNVSLTYRFDSTNYLFTVEGQVSGLGPNGAVLLVGMGPGIRNTEADSIDNQHQLAIVTEANGATATHFSKLATGQTTTFPGPFDWVAVKSKYFVNAIFTLDTTKARISGATATPLPATGKSTTRADIEVSMPLTADGKFGYQVYAGAMEYRRLGLIGHDFDDVNPYGWPGFRTVIRPVAGAVRWLLLWMHDHLHLAYGVVLVCFGIMIRLILWPLNQKAMRSSMAMQAIQPHLKEIQERYKNEPQKLQQEMFKIYKEHGVNPFGGCWPLLIPMPVLFALFFVLGNTIELRGESFLWLPDLSRPDPHYIVPILMGLSMFVLSRVGSRGMPPSPQTKMMMYVMPVMMTVLFLNFASGLNLYYAVQNTASIPQQWLLSNERLRRNPLPPPAPPKKK